MVQDPSAGLDLSGLPLVAHDAPIGSGGVPHRTEKEITMDLFVVIAVVLALLLLDAFAIAFGTDSREMRTDDWRHA